jgi:transcriptional regulator with XRE-family HTH domain
VNRKLNLIGPQIRSIRNKRGISQSELARKCQLIGWDISREGLAKIESRFRGVADYEIIALAFALEVPFDLLMPEKEKLLKLIKNCFWGGTRKA